MVNSIKGDWMSQKRNMSKQQRIYLEHKNKEKIKKELEELAKDTSHYENSISSIIFDPHKYSYYN
jgi:hypothetical protein